MKLARLFLPLSLLFMATYANAASVALTEEDCLEILERYAADPESVPQHLLDACKEMLGAIAPGAGDAQKPTADPCADPATANSVQCWGPWAALAPAAAGFKPTELAAVKEFDTRPELAEAFTTQFQLPDLPLGECAAGAACGFATLAPGLVAQPADTAASNIVPFSIAAGGGNFQLNPGDVVTGVQGVTSLDGLQSPGFAGPSRFQGANGDTGSLIIANVNSDANGELIDAMGLWRHGSLTNQNDSNTSAGVFAWGIASSQDVLDRLNAGNNITATFSGNMASDTRTSATMTINFGTQPNWSGNWQNAERGFNFDARGGISGANLISTGFSSDVIDDGSSYVQGILQGEEGNQSVAHAININLTNGGIIKDVGTLRQLQ
ncbi:MAG: hypothetical protein ACR2PS_04810 [Pseudomonadales bacterium]